MGWEAECAMACRETIWLDVVIGSNMVTYDFEPQMEGAVLRKC